jgi:hypothetical protein
MLATFAGLAVAVAANNANAQPQRHAGDPLSAATHNLAAHETSLIVRKADATPAAPHSKFCVYSAHTVDELDSFQTLLGRGVDCAVLFGNMHRWSTWTQPWFVGQPTYTYDWAGWAKADPNRRLVVTQALIPDNGTPTDWLHQGALGTYNGYAKTLATNLINAGLGNSIIRLAHEANGYWYKDIVPEDAQGQADWRTFWANTVTAMRSVPGAQFVFDWTVNYQVRRSISLNDFYPGDAYVDVVGLDAYDENLKVATGRYPLLVAKAGGIQQVMDFANQHGKPMSMPEWGMLPWGGAMDGGGDDPAYVDGIGTFVAANHIVYSGYWFAHQPTMDLLQNSPGAIAALRQHFGVNGDAR